MPSETELFQLFQSALAIGIAIVLYTLYRRTRSDSFREDMFTIRDEMFDFMWKNNLSFETPCYRFLRDALNGAIRVGDQLTIITFVHLARELAARGKDSGWSERISQVNDPIARTHFEDVHARVALRLMKYLFLEGLAGLLFNPILAVAGSLEYISKLKERWAFRPAERCAYELVAFGRDDTPATRLLASRRLLLKGS